MGLTFSPEEWDGLMHTSNNSPSSDLHISQSPLDTQVGGDHYKQFKIQPFEYITKNNMGFAQGNIIKYASRYLYKNGIEDLEKAKHYIDLEIERITELGK